MKLGITSKLFLALLATCLAVIIIMSLTVRITFERGLLDYVNTEDLSRSSILARILADNYKEHDGWQWLREDRRHWHELLMEKYGPPPFNPPFGKEMPSVESDHAETSEEKNLSPE